MTVIQNSNMSEDSSEVEEGQSGPHIVVFNCTQPVPITTPPQQSFRDQPVNHLEQSSKSLINNVNDGTPESYSVKTNGQNSTNIKSWPKNCSSDQNPRLISQDSVVINFDNISEPSTSQSVVSHGPHSLEQCQLQMSADDNDLNLCSGSGERNTNGESNNRGSINNANSNVPVTENDQEHNDSSFSNSNISVTENNEGTQTDNTHLRPVPENYSLDKIFNKYTPFVSFLLFKATYDHREGILIFVGLLVIFIHADSVIKREVSKQSHRSVLSLGIIFVNLFVSICLIYFAFQDQQLHKNLIFIPPYSQPLTLWDVLWIVGITDFVLKFITMQLKVGMACFPGKWLPYAARGKWYLFLERTSQLYRSLAPIQPWLYYLFEIYQGPENTIGMCFSVAYIVSKGSDITTKVKLFVKAFWKLLHNTSLGTRPTKEQMDAAGSQCPICHDEYNSPVMLQCCHVFCESCVSVWFDREQTCPLCRAKIADDPSWRDGATSLFTQLF